MSESSAENTTPQTLQEEVEKVWEDESHWKEGHQVEMDGLPEGTRLVEVDPDTLILRSLIPNAPQNEDSSRESDVPVAVFGTRTNPEELKKEAMKVGTAIIKGDVRIENAQRPLPQPPKNR